MDWHGTADHDLGYPEQPEVRVRGAELKQDWLQLLE